MLCFYFIFYKFLNILKYWRSNSNSRVETYMVSIANSIKFRILNEVSNPVLIRIQFEFQIWFFSNRIKKIEYLNRNRKIIFEYKFAS